MSPDIYSVCQYLSQLLEVSSFDDMVPNGMQVEGKRPLRKIASAVTASLYAINEAEKKDADILLVHHGLFFKNGFTGLRGLVRNRTESLIQSGIHLLAYHLPLDAHREFGNAWPAAEQLGLTDLVPFGRYNGKMIGVRGSLSTPMSAKSFYQKLQGYWGTAGIFLSNDENKEVKTWAFVSGQGHRFLQEALDERIDCFINGTVDEASWHQVRESGIQFMAFGHFVTEKLGVQLLGNHLAERFGLEHMFIDEPNPY